MYKYGSKIPILKSFSQRRWLIFIFWINIIGGILCGIYSYFMFFVDVEVFLVLMLFSMNFFYNAYLYHKAFNGYDDWESYLGSKTDFDELFEIADMEEGEEKKKRFEQVEERKKEYDRIWKITWKLRLLNWKEEVYLKKVEKKKTKFEKKRKKLEKELTPRCEGIKI